MMAGIEEKISVTGAEEAKRQLDAHSDSLKGVGAAADQTADKGGRLSRWFGGMIARLGLAAGAWRAVTAVIQEHNRALREGAEAMQRMAEAQRDFLALAEQLDARERERVTGMAPESGRSVEEVSRAYAILKSSTPTLSQDDRMAMLGQVLQTGKTTSASLEPITRAFTLLNSLTGLRGEALQNLFRQTQIEAGEADVGRIAANLGKTMEIAPSAGFGPAEAAGLFSVATRMQGSERAATALGAIFSRLVGHQTPEGQAILQAAGVRADMTGMQRFSTVAQAIASQRISFGQAQQLVGQEAAGTMLSLSRNWGSVQQAVGNIGGAVASGRDLTGAFVESMMRDPMQRSAFEVARSRVQRDIAQADAWGEGGSAVEIWRNRLERERARVDMNPAFRSLMELDYWAGTEQFGVDPESVARRQLSRMRWLYGDSVNLYENCTVNHATPALSTPPGVPGADRGTTD